MTGTATADQPVLQVNDLVVHFPATGAARGAVVHALDGVSFTVARGRSFGIVGESGSGKSTAALAVMRLAPATAGAVVLDGEDFLALRGKALRQARRHIQMIFQDPFSSLDPRRRAGDLIAEPIRLLEGMSRRAAAERVPSLLSVVGLPPDAANLFPHQFSGGQRQRLCIARALSTQPELIVCDEAVSALDVAIQAQILNLLKRLQAERGLAYIFISHDLGVVQGRLRRRGGDVPWADRGTSAGAGLLLGTTPSIQLVADLCRGSRRGVAGRAAAAPSGARGAAKPDRSAAWLPVRRTLPFRRGPLPHGRTGVARGGARACRGLPPHRRDRATRFRYRRAGSDAAVRRRRIVNDRPGR